MAESFVGFSQELVDFYRELALNNNKTWFDANKSRYETFVLTPARRFVSAMGDRIRQFAPGVHAIPQVNKSLFRINRDTRFSKDKTPYKLSMAMIFWDGEGRKRMELPGFYLHYEAEQVFVGGGLHQFPEDLLKKYRDLVAKPEIAEELDRIVSEIETDEHIRVGGEALRTLPRGYDADGTAAKYLRHKGLYTSSTAELPASFFTAGFVDYCEGFYRRMLPLHRWIMDNLIEG